MKKFGIACVLACLSLPVFADRLYVVGEVGQIKWDLDGDSINKTQWYFAGGYAFSLPFKDELAVELGYRHMGVLHDKDNLYAYRSELSALQLSLISHHKFTSEFSVFGRLGVAQLDVDWKATRLAVPNTSVEKSKTTERAVVGIGASYAFNEKLSALIEYTYMTWEELRLTGPNVGLQYSF